MKLKGLFDIYRTRYAKLKAGFPAIEGNDLADRERSRELWNMAFAGLGAGTLMLRLGAIVQVAWYVQEIMDNNPDPALNKMLVEKLRDKPVSDGDWKDLWLGTARMADESSPAMIKQLVKLQGEVLSGFVNARNSIVHLTGSGLSLAEWNKILKSLDIMVGHSLIFDTAELVGSGAEIILSTGTEKINLYPLVNRSAEGAPLIFQGVQETEMKLLDGVTGSEQTISLETVTEYFSRIEKKASDRYIDDSRDLVARYTELFVGREDELERLFSLLANGERIIRLTSPAGMGKSAFMATAFSACKKALHERGIACEALVHFCGPAPSSNPVSVLQNLLYQDTNLWQGADDSIRISPKTSLSADFTILRDRFHQLCMAWSKQQKKNKDKGKAKHLLIFIDGLDESSKVYKDPAIDSLFMVDEKDEEGRKLEKPWEVPEYVAFILGYRIGSTYRLPENTTEIRLQALSHDVINQVPWPKPLSPATRDRLKEKGRPFGQAASQLVDPAFLRLYYDMVIRGSASTENPASVPEGLTGLYDEELASFGYSREMELLDGIGIIAAAAEPLPLKLAEIIYGRLTGQKNGSAVKDIICLRPGWFNVSPDGDLSLYHDRLRAWVLTRLSNRDIQRIHGVYADVLKEILETNMDNKKTP